MDTTDDVKQAAKVIGRRGGNKGGPARAAAMTPEERKESAQHAAMVRWQSKFPTDEKAVLLKATHGSPQRPLRIGDIEIPCYVLEDGRRVIVQSGLRHALSMGRGMRGDRLATFAQGKAMAPFIPKHLHDAITTPIFFRTPTGHRAYGYEATVLADLCEAILSARDAGTVLKQQEHIVAQCEILMRGFARVGIIALVDEATGYQQDRERDELHKILAAYISPDLLPWAKRFPEEFYQHLCRLWGWQYSPRYKGPRRISQLTNQLVYDKLPPGVVDELRRLNPPVYHGSRRKHRHHQFLTETIGNPHLEKHLLLLVTILRVAETWEQFERFFAATFPTPAAPLALPEPEPEPDVIDVTPESVEV